MTRRFLFVVIMIGAAASAGAQAAIPAEYEGWTLMDLDAGLAVVAGGTSQGSFAAPVLAVGVAWSSYPFAWMLGGDMVVGSGELAGESIFITGFGLAASTFHPLASHPVMGGGLSYYMAPAEILYAFGRLGYSWFLGPYRVSSSKYLVRAYLDAGYAANFDVPADSGLFFKPTLTFLMVTVLGSDY